LLLALTVSPVSATILRPLSDQELTARAHTIVIGRAIARQTVWTGQDLATLVTVAVTESIKGDSSSSLTVALPGGIDRRRKIPVQVLYVGAPQIARDEEVLLFLERADRSIPGAYVVSGFSQGKLSIIAGPDGVKWVSRGPQALARNPRAGVPPASTRQRLSDLRYEIRLHLQAGTP
jgi:hypothetical protein